MELSNAKGTRDFEPYEKIIRNEIVNTLVEVFELFGYNPIETPILERYETLAAKFAAGEESDAMKETFKLIDQGERNLGLRFDLTVPFSRYVGMRPNIKMPFKKYMLGSVFRDGPIKLGRYREFMQVDPDIVGCKSVVAEAEIISMVSMAFKKLELDVKIVLNNRKIINGILEENGIKDKDMFNVIVTIDKLEKYGESVVKKELKEKNFDDKVLGFFKKKGNNNKTLEELKDVVKNEIGLEGIKEIEELLDYLDVLEITNVVFDPSLARGLGYYTGPVFEVFLKDSEITSSIAGGGRYDKMIGNYLGGNREYPATGISFGIDVIIEAMRMKKKLVKKSVSDVFIIPIKTLKESLVVAKKLRENGVKTDIDIMQRGVSKNLDYANSYEIPFVVFIGEDELKQDKFKLREMKTGKEELLSLSDVVKRIRY